MAKIQRLCYRGFEFEAVQGGDGRTLEGYAAVFDTPTRINSYEGIFDERIARGAFAKSIAERKPVLQFDHGRDARTGSVPIGSLQEIREDDKGLFVKARLFDNQAVEPIRQAIEGGAIDGMSFRFKVNQERWTDQTGMPVRDAEVNDLLRDPDERGPLAREVREVELYEAGPVVFPAYTATSVGVRSMLLGLDDEDRLTLLDELLEERAQAMAKKKKKMSMGDEDMGDDEDMDEEDEDTPKKKAKKKPAQKGSYSAGTTSEARQREMELLRLPFVRSLHKKDGGGDKTPYGDVTYADPGYQSDGVKRYPVDTEKHVKAAWSYINQSDNASKYSPAQLAKIKAKIKAAAKKFGVEISAD